MTNREKRQLYYELVRLRDYYKEYGRRKTGRAPLVCSDDALISLVELCPKKLDDFYNVPEIGEHFVEYYAENFLNVIRKYSMEEAEYEVEMTPEQEHILKELEKKLTSINSRNRLLYFPRLTNKTGCDLSSIEDREALERFLIGKKRLTIDSDTDPEENFLYKRSRQVTREASKEQREKGQNNLYIGYPFVKGRLFGENFDVRAPLILFPVEADTTPEKIVITIDESRDIQFNSALILANFKFNGIKDALPDVAIDTLETGRVASVALDYYKENYINIEDNSENELTEFEEYKKETFPRYRNGELFLEPCAVLGRYPVCDNAIQKDFDEILERGIINKLLEKLLEGVIDIETIDDSYEGEFELPIDERELVISEKDLNYINDLNSSQEAVIKAANSLDSLVVQGPPGTGKSQTIASLIADAATRGKTVLMVSEKKTALDVVYSRLGDLSRYALLIDDVTNKNLFYKQLEQIMTRASIGRETPDALSEITISIDDDIKDLEKVADALYSANERIGTEPYKLYLENEKIDFEDEEEREIANILSGLTGDIAEWDYPRIRRCYDFFTRGDTLECCIDIERIYSNYPLIECIKEGLTTNESYSLVDDAEKAEAAITEWLRKGFFSRVFSKGSLNDNIIKPFTNKYLTINPETAFSWMVVNKNVLSETTKQYRVFQDEKPVYDKLNEDELTYLKAVYKSSLEIEGDLDCINFTVYNYMLFNFIDIFQHEHRELFRTIYNFDSVVKELSRLINEKKKITKARLVRTLEMSAEDMRASKRGREINRSVESRRRMSINRFVGKYSFELFKYIKIWLLTPEVVSEIIPLQNGVFDLVVFDEASQMYVEKGLPSILRAKKVVVAGDSKQLRPSSLGSGRLEISEDEFPEEEDVPASLEEESLLDLARHKFRDILLNFHYRSKYEELIAFSNYAFYKAGLYVSPNVRVPKNPPIEVLKIDNGLWTKRANVPEAKKVVELLKWILANRKNNETIGIITFNVSQRDMIDELIDEEAAVDPKFAAQLRTELKRTHDGQDIGLFVKNIESVQGDERDVIIFSVGYAKNENGKIIRNFGWLNQKGGENRLNVAVSRAKKKVYVVTSIYPEELRVEDAKNNGPRYLRKYLEYAFAISNRDNETAKNVLNSFGDQINPGELVSFDSDFEREVYDALIDEGYVVDTQVGIGGYSIDLAIKYEGNYILGIECDGKLYHSSKSARERDYHRQKYLESRGWIIHRIWSTNWWDNPGNEIKKITRIVESRIQSIEAQKEEIETTKTVVSSESPNTKEVNQVPAETLSSTMSAKARQIDAKPMPKGAAKSITTGGTGAITKAPKKPHKQTVEKESEKRHRKTGTNYYDIYPITKSPKKKFERGQSNMQQQPLFDEKKKTVDRSIAQQTSLFDETITPERKCENCKFYRNDECAGLGLCDSYEQVPGAK